MSCVPSRSAAPPPPSNLAQGRRNLLFIGKRRPLFDYTAAHRRLFELMRLLRGMGHHVTYAADPRGALEVSQGSAPEPLPQGRTPGVVAVVRGLHELLEATTWAAPP